MHGDGGRVGVVRAADVVPGVGTAGRPDQQVGRGPVALGRDDADAAALRVEPHHLGAGPHHTI